MPLSITKKTHGFKIDTKRFNIPFVFESLCPNCGEIIAKDMSQGDHYLAYPSLGPNTVVFYCDHCDHEWSEPFILNIEATLP